MRSNYITLVTILLDLLLVSCSVLIGLPSAESYSQNQNNSARPGELGRNPKLSSPEECARTCYAGEPPKTCYYHFTLEHYTVLGKACEICTPNNTSSNREQCQCVLADGVEKSISTVNRMLPGPSIEVCKGDYVVIDVENNLGGMEVTIHWHGLLQNGYQYYDGVPFVTQCPIFAGNTFRYQWLAQTAGTYFWHSHAGMHRTDGIQGSIIIREPYCDEPNRNLYDEDLSAHVMFMSDWLHELAASRFPGFLRTHRGQYPESLLINGKGQYTYRNNGSTTNTPLEVFTIKPGRRYRFRLINAFSMVCGAHLVIQDHALTLIATDGQSVRPVNVNSIISYAGERYDFIIDGNQPTGAYWIQLRALGECGATRVQQLGILRYEGGPEKPSSKPPSYDEGLPQGVVVNPLDGLCNTPRKDAICINQLKHASPIDKGILEPHPDVKIYLPYRFGRPTPEQQFKPETYNRFLVTGRGGLVVSYVDGYSFAFPPSPLLSQLNDVPSEQFCNATQRPVNCEANCTCTHRIDIPLNAVVEVVLIDEVGVANLSHPFHLHGYSFNVVGMGRSPDKNITKITMKHVRNLDRRGLLRRNWDMVPFKDTIAVPTNGYVIFRFRADNPGEWLFHCHFQYHTAIGMELLFHVGTRKDLPSVPRGFPKCGDFEPSIPPIDVDDSIHFL